MTPPEMRGGMIAEGRSLAKDTGGRRDLRAPSGGSWNFDGIVKNAGLGGVLAGPVDGMAAETETEIAAVASAAAERADKEQFVENVLAEAFSSGAVNRGAATVGTIGGLCEGKHGTVLFLAWSRRLYTTGNKNVRRCTRSAD